MKQDAVSNNIVIGYCRVLENETPALLQKHVIEAIKNESILKNITDVYIINSNYEKLVVEEKQMANRIVVKTSNKMTKNYVLSNKQIICPNINQQHSSKTIVKKDDCNSTKKVHIKTFNQMKTLLHKHGIGFNDIQARSNN